MFKRKYSEDDVIRLLSERPMTLFEIEKSMWSCKITSRRLLGLLMTKGMVSRRNRGSPNRPTWEYFLLNKIDLPKQDTKKSFKNMATKLK